MGGQQKDFVSDIVFFQHQDGMRLKVRRHFLQCTVTYMGEYEMGCIFLAPLHLKFQ
jgi:hypothetical protein